MLHTFIALTLAASVPAPPSRISIPHHPVRDTTDTRPGVAVLPFTNGGSFGGRTQEDLSALEVGLQQMLMTELEQNSALRIVERAALRQMLEEQNLATAGRVDAATAARVGRLVGARYVITGSFINLDGQFRLDGHVVDVETGELVKAQQVYGRRRDLFHLLVDLAGVITRDVRLPPLPRDVATARARLYVPNEAALKYSQALRLAESGRNREAMELYREIVRRFPDYTPARARLQQLEGAAQ